MAKKHYVVWEGHRKGVFDNWEECERSIKGYVGANFKSFPTRNEAFEAYKAGKGGGGSKSSSKEAVIWDSISVDAACSGNPGLMEYRGVLTQTKEELFHRGPYPDGTNNIGEFLALVHGLSLLKKKESKLPVYTDSITAMKWVKDKKANTKLVPTTKNGELFELIRRAEKWLRENSYDTKIIKWDTPNLGEIPADFGRK